MMVGGVVVGGEGSTLFDWGLWVRYAASVKYGSGVRAGGGQKVPWQGGRVRGVV